MIIAKSSKFGPVRIDGTVNLGGWFGKRWLVGIGCGYGCFIYLVEAGDEQSAIDELVDSNHGHVVKYDDDYVKEMDAKVNALIEAFGEEKAEKVARETDHEIANWFNVERCGNYGDPVDLEDLRILERATEVNFFAPKDALD